MSDKQFIFDRLCEAGCTPTGALALMGNWELESGLEACRLEGDFSSDHYPSHLYADRVDNGLMSEDTFCHDAKGWGLAQWTWWSRKQNLLRFCRERSVSIANTEAQVDFAVHELETSYPAIWDYLCNVSPEHLHTAVDMVCRQYERPAYNNVEARYNAALRIKDELKAEGETYWPPRVLCMGMKGADVSVLQSLLVAHGYDAGKIDGVFGEMTEAAVRAYQRDNNLCVDGIAGNMTFSALMKF